jgi:adenylate kinase family enzyme
MDAGELVTLEIVLDLIKVAMLKAIEKGSKGFLIDGYPREGNFQNSFWFAIFLFKFRKAINLSPKLLQASWLCSLTAS